ncbi:MAG: GAF domain-containing protein [Spirulina sp. SIO3F2]|nr:GAF domain-containing protein [Spirulina sp. SIO3F2]
MASQYQRGLEFADIALQLSYKLKSQSQQSSVCFLLGGWIHVWSKPIQGAIQINYEGFLAGMESGELQYAGYNLLANIYNRLFQGENLASIATDIEKYWTIAKQIQNDLLSSVLVACQFFVRTFLTTQNEQEGERLESSSFPEEQTWIEDCERAQAYLPLGIYYILQIHASCLTQNYDRGIGYAIKAGQVLPACAGSTPSAGYFYYNSLNWLGLYFTLPEVERQKALDQIEANQAQLKIWSDSCPENFLHKYLLVEAERSRIAGKRTEAIELYDLAIAEAKDNAYIQEEALASELAALFYLNWDTPRSKGKKGKEKVAAGYMQEAYYNYARWGARFKTADLESRYPQLLAPILERKTSRLKISGTISKTRAEAQGMLDLASMMKAIRTLSEEIELNGAIASFMQILRENAGAETIALMLLQEQELMLIAKVADSNTLSIEPIPVADCNAIPNSIINQVKNRCTPLVLDDVSQETVYAGDPYIEIHQPQSILCLPLITRTELTTQKSSQAIGILYLENNCVAGAFTHDRVEILSLLCAQAAITLENARLYQQVQQTLQLERELHELQQTQLQLIQSEKMFSLGQMVAGIAHEINNPINFIHGNIVHANAYIKDVLHILSLYQEACPQTPDSVQIAMDAIDFPFLQDDFEILLKSMRTGSDRIKNIVTSLRNFARLDESEFKAIDVHTGIESTLRILQNRLQKKEKRAEIEVIKDYGDLPFLECYAGQLNQVFMNILNNAIDALEECDRTEKLSLVIHTEMDNKEIKITISDIAFSTNMRYSYIGRK